MKPDILIQSIIQASQEHMALLARLAGLAEELVRHSVTTEGTIASLTDREQRILAAFPDDESILTGPQLAKTLHVSYSGTFKQELARMVAIGVLENLDPGYRRLVPQPGVRELTENTGAFAGVNGVRRNGT